MSVDAMSSSSVSPLNDTVNRGLLSSCYVCLKEIYEANRLSLFAVVDAVRAAPSAHNERQQVEMQLQLTDDSLQLPAGQVPRYSAVKCTLFAPQMDDLPQIAMGDVVSLDGVKVQKDKKRGKELDSLRAIGRMNTGGLQVVVWSKNGRTMDVKYRSPATGMTPVGPGDRLRVRALLRWHTEVCAGEGGVACPSTASQLCDVRQTRGYYQLLGVVIAVIRSTDTGQGDPAIVRVCDGTHISLEKVTRIPKERIDVSRSVVNQRLALDGELQSFYADIFAYDEYIEHVMKNVKPGDVVFCRNVHAYFSLKSRFEDRATTFTLHGGGARYGRCLLVIDRQDSKAQDLLASVEKVVGPLNLPWRQLKSGSYDCDIDGDISTPSVDGNTSSSPKIHESQDGDVEEQSDVIEVPSEFAEVSATSGSDGEPSPTKRIALSQQAIREASTTRADDISGSESMQRLEESQSGDEDDERPATFATPPEEMPSVVVNVSLSTVNGGNIESAETDIAQIPPKQSDCCQQAVIISGATDVSKLKRLPLRSPTKATSNGQQAAALQAQEEHCTELPVDVWKQFLSKLADTYPKIPCRGDVQFFLKFVEEARYHLPCHELLVQQKIDGSHHILDDLKALYQQSKDYDQKPTDSACLEHISGCPAMKRMFSHINDFVLVDNDEFGHGEDLEFL